MKHKLLVLTVLVASTAAIGAGSWLVADLRAQQQSDVQQRAYMSHELLLTFSKAISSSTANSLAVLVSGRLENFDPVLMGAEIYISDLNKLGSAITVLSKEPSVKSVQQNSEVLQPQ